MIACFSRVGTTIAPLLTFVVGAACDQQAQDRHPNPIPHQSTAAWTKVTPPEAPISVSMPVTPDKQEWDQGGIRTIGYNAFVDDQALAFILTINRFPSDFFRGLDDGHVLSDLAKRDGGGNDETCVAWHEQPATVDGTPALEFTSRIQDSGVTFAGRGFTVPFGDGNVTASVSAVEGEAAVSDPRVERFLHSLHVRREVSPNSQAATSPVQTDDDHKNAPQKRSPPQFPLGEKTSR